MKADVQVKASKSSSPTSREKRVSFADLVGLKLEFVKTITPCSSEDNLCGIVGVWKDSCCDMNGNLLRMRRMICLKPCFMVPSRTEDFIERVQSQNAIKLLISICGYRLCYMYSLYLVIIISRCYRSALSMAKLVFPS